MKHHCKRIFIFVIMITFFIVVIGLLAELRGCLSANRHGLAEKITGVETEVPYQETSTTALWID
jgi:hypothetical protein